MHEFDSLLQVHVLLFLLVAQDALDVELSRTSSGTLFRERLELDDAVGAFDECLWQVRVQASLVRACCGLLSFVSSAKLVTKALIGLIEEQLWLLREIDPAFFDRVSCRARSEDLHRVPVPGSASTSGSLIFDLQTLAQSLHPLKLFFLLLMLLRLLQLLVSEPQEIQSKLSMDRCRFPIPVRWLDGLLRACLGRRL